MATLVTSTTLPENSARLVLPLPSKVGRLNSDSELAPSLQSVYMDWAMRPGSRSETRLTLFMMETGVRPGAARIYSRQGHYVIRISVLNDKTVY